MTTKRKAIRTGSWNVAIVPVVIVTDVVAIVIIISIMIINMIINISINRTRGKYVCEVSLMPMPKLLTLMTPLWTIGVLPIMPSATVLLSFQLTA